MKKKIHLAIFIIQKDLEHYRQSKNVDLVTILSSKYFAFLNVFFKKNANILSSYCLYNYAIHLKKDAQPLAFALYDMSRNEALELCRYLNKNLSKEFIRVSRSQATISILFVKKSRDKLRFYVNYKDLNAITIKNQYSLFSISKTLNHLSRVKIFIKLNIIFAFNRLRIQKKDEVLIVFRIRFDLFEYLVMLFDLCNKLVSFQEYINDILREFLDKFCIAYLNNILIYNDNKLEYEIYVKLIF